MKLYKFILAVTLPLMAVGCKTTEQNYRNAYLTAKESQRQKADSDADNRIEAERNGIPTKVGDIMVPIKAGYFSEVEHTDESGTPARFSVVVGQFKQIFNARMFRNRLIENKCKAYILRDGSGEFYVVARGFDSIDEATKYIADINKNLPVKVPIEPFVIKNAAVK
ncbi:MAG: hypothetical protein K2J74_00830 [Muribaculaceae bacterium]|nr:hypothetical protein [Muribaculaceae bacterium]